MLNTEYSVLIGDNFPLLFTQSTRQVMYCVTRKLCDDVRGGQSYIYIVGKGGVVRVVTHKILETFLGLGLTKIFLANGDIRGYPQCFDKCQRQAQVQVCSPSPA